MILKCHLFDRSKKFIDPLYQIWEDMSAEELQEFKKPIKKVNKVVISIHFSGNLKELKAVLYLNTTFVHSAITEHQTQVMFL